MQGVLNRGLHTVANKYFGEFERVVSLLEHACSKQWRLVESALFAEALHVDSVLVYKLQDLREVTLLQRGEEGCLLDPWHWHDCCLGLGSWLSRLLLLEHHHLLLLQHWLLLYILLYLLLLLDTFHRNHCCCC